MRGGTGLAPALDGLPPGLTEWFPAGAVILGQTQLASGTEFLAIAGDRISVYRWDGGDVAPDPVRTVRVALDGYRIVAAARTGRHVAILATGTVRRAGSGRGLSLWHDLGRSAPTHRCTELLLLLEAGSFRELGSAALERRFDAVWQAPPPPRWTDLSLSETHLHFQDAITGPISIRLGDGPVGDLQQQIHACSGHAFQSQETPRVQCADRS